MMLMFGKNKLVIQCVYAIIILFIAITTIFPTFTESQDTLWRAPTARYEVVDYPVFVFHPRQHQLNLGETLNHMHIIFCQYRLVWVVEFVIHWCSHLCQFVLRNRSY